ncbi:SDR family NAD(P)-dependent oxidoreductase [Flavobacterium sp. RHBU_24]|uniref:SDR family NAD(P)-dependent oxidoreductase n=1 Tax=Flavobacterium sp. RHBU_24 TaxID=3391185 RepID=UPI003984E318
MKTTLITGASGGIGEAIARRLAEKKENLTLVARSETRLRHLCQELSTQYGVSVGFIAADLFDPEAPKAVYLECKVRGLEVTSLINNAGIGSGGEFAGADLKSLENMLQLNNGALVNLTHLFMQDMLKRKAGNIVNMGSLISFAPVPYMALYGASKAFVRFFTLALYEECKPYGVHVLFFAPGLTSTNFMEAAALKNETGDALIAGAPAQTADQVAEEFIKAYYNRKRAAVSGRINRFAVKLLALIPNSAIAKSSARTFKKRMNKKS